MLCYKGRPTVHISCTWSNTQTADAHTRIPYPTKPLNHSHTLLKGHQDQPKVWTHLNTERLSPPYTFRPEGLGFVYKTNKQ